MAILPTDEIVRLSPAERLSLIAQPWDSLEQHHLPLSQAQESELNRRLDSVEEDRTQAIAWPDLKSKLDQRPQDTLYVCPRGSPCGSGSGETV
jgi:putative addiction module component (TIGR02574 family)